MKSVYGSCDKFSMMDGFDAPHNERRSVTLALIIGSLFDEFATVIFDFILVVFLSSVFPDSLLLVSIYGLTNALLLFFSGGKCQCGIVPYRNLDLQHKWTKATNISIVFSLGASGRFVDAAVANNRRLQSTLMLLTGQYLCMLACCVMCYAYLNWKGDVWLPLIIVFSGFVSLSTAASAISIENDWIVVISDSNTEYLSALNVALRRVHLVARMTAPAVAGYSLKMLDNQLNKVLIAMGGLGLLSFHIKYKCLKRICSLAPILVMQRGDDDDISEDEEQIQTQGNGEEQKHCTSCSMIGGYLIYFQQKISMGGFGFALLYLNVMTFGSLMTSYLIWRGLDLSHLGVARGASEVFGLVGTIAFASSSGRFALRTIAVVSIGYMALCLSVSVCGTFFVPNDNGISLWMLILGVVLSRVGLWANELSIFQLTQRTVDENIRGIVGGSQSSMNYFFYLLNSTLGIIFSDPENFYVLCLIGYSAVISAFLLMLRGVYFSKAFRNLEE